MSISEAVKKGLQRDSIREKLARDGEIFRLRYGAEQVFDLTADYPALEPPPAFAKELRGLMSVPRAGLHRYMENAGYTDTRTIIAAHLKALSGLDFSLGEVIMTSGASGAINMAIKAVLNPGEEVVLLAPVAYDYEAYVQNHAGTVHLVPCLEDWSPNLEALEATLSPRTKIVLLNSPNNPSGVVYSEAQLQKIAGIVLRRSEEFNTRIYIVSDDSYRKFYYGPQPCPWILKHYPHCIIVSSYSKEFSIPGERIGYTAISPLCEEARVVVGGLIHANRTLGFVNAPALMQNTVTNLQRESPEAAFYQAKRDFLYQSLTGMGYQAQKPEGGFFILVKAPRPDENELINALLEQHILALPGSLFQAPGWVRLSYCVEQSVLENSLPGFRQALAALSR